MPDVKTAKLFPDGRSQAVRLPQEFRFEGDRVRVRRLGRGVLLEPLITDVDAWFAELDRHGPEPFMAEGRDQPRTAAFPISLGSPASPGRTGRRRPSDHLP